MAYNSSDPEARDLGFTLPTGTDLIRHGDNAISDNARVATGAIRAVLNRLRALEDKPPPVFDHGALTGLTGDDHPHYLTNARGDARYPRLGHTHPLTQVDGLTAALDGKAATGHTHTPEQIGAVPADDPRLLDTGWRVVSSWTVDGVVTGAPLPAGVVPRAFGLIRWRRLGHRVTMRLSGAELTDPSFTIPPAFQPGSPSELVSVPMMVFAGVVKARVATTAVHVTGSGIAETTYASEITYTSSTTFPSEPYPGTPA